MHIENSTLSNFFTNYVLWRCNVLKRNSLIYHCGYKLMSYMFLYSVIMLSDVDLSILYLNLKFK
jgi:hypothetical protein